MNCPHCDSPEVEHRKYSEKVDRSVYKCRSCGRRFRVDDDGVRADGGLDRCKDDGCDEWAEPFYNSQCPEHWNGRYVATGTEQ